MELNVSMGLQSDEDANSNRGEASQRLSEGDTDREEDKQ